MAVASVFNLIDWYPALLHENTSVQLDLHIGDTFLIHDELWALRSKYSFSFYLPLRFPTLESNRRKKSQLGNKAISLKQLNRLTSADQTNHLNHCHRFKELKLWILKLIFRSGCPRMPRWNPTLDRDLTLESKLVLLKLLHHLSIYDT